MKLYHTCYLWTRVIAQQEPVAYDGYSIAPIASNEQSQISDLDRLQIQVTAREATLDPKVIVQEKAATTQLNDATNIEEENEEDEEDIAADEPIVEGSQNALASLLPQTDLPTTTETLNSPPAYNPLSTWYPEGTSTTSPTEKAVVEPLVELVAGSGPGSNTEFINTQIPEQKPIIAVVDLSAPVESTQNSPPGEELPGSVKEPNCRGKIFSDEGVLQMPPSAPKQPLYYYPAPAPEQAPYPDLSGLVGTPGLQPGVSQQGGVYPYPGMVVHQDVHPVPQMPGQNMGPAYSGLNPLIHPPNGPAPNSANGPNGFNGFNGQNPFGGRNPFINPLSPLFQNQGRGPPLPFGFPPGGYGQNQGRGNPPNTMPYGYPPLGFGQGSAQGHPPGPGQVAGQGQAPQAPRPPMQPMQQGQHPGYPGFPGNSANPGAPPRGPQGNPQFPQFPPNPLDGLGELGELGVLGSLGGLGGLAGLAPQNQQQGELPSTVGGPYLPPADQETELYVDKVPPHAPLEHAVDHPNGHTVKESAKAIQNKQAQAENLDSRIPTGLVYSTDEIDTLQENKYAFDGNGYLTYDAVQGNWYVSVNGTNGEAELLPSNGASTPNWKQSIWMILFSLV